MAFWQPNGGFTITSRCVVAVRRFVTYRLGSRRIASLSIWYYPRLLTGLPLVTPAFRVACGLPQHRSRAGGSFSWRLTRRVWTRGVTAARANGLFHFTAYADATPVPWRGNRLVYQTPGAWTNARASITGGQRGSLRWRLVVPNGG